MQAFQSEKGLTERPAQEDADLVTLNNKLHVLQQTQSGKLREITEDELLVEDLDDLQSQLEEAEEKLKDYKKKYDLLTCTIEMLRQADYSLKERYIKPVKDSFLKYSAVLEKALGEKVTMSKDFEIRYERGGKERSERHLSAGQRSLCALCFRLALIENMYATEKPFLILDDPFVSLDDEHMQRARLLLNELTKGMQIIYFACHPSRDLNN
jgi:DNA repair exonuclease SbcCD ATPase subunit